MGAEATSQRIWKVIVEDEHGPMTVLLRSGRPGAIGRPRDPSRGLTPFCELTIDDHGEMTLVTPERASQALFAFSIKTPPTLVSDGRRPPSPFAGRSAAGTAKGPLARLVFENLNPESVQIDGLEPNGTVELTPTRPITLGRVGDVRVNAQIGGRRNSVFRFDTAIQAWIVEHLQHGCPIYLNGVDITNPGRAALKDGDCIDPGGEVAIGIFFFQQP